MLNELRGNATSESLAIAVNRLWGMHKARNTSADSRSALG